jgi:hypothetical protein
MFICQIYGRNLKINTLWVLHIDNYFDIASSLEMLFDPKADGAIGPRRIQAIALE